MSIVIFMPYKCSVYRQGSGILFHPCIIFSLLRPLSERLLDIFQLNVVAFCVFFSSPPRQLLACIYVFELNSQIQVFCIILSGSHFLPNQVYSYTFMNQFVTFAFWRSHLHLCIIDILYVALLSLWDTSLLYNLVSRIGVFTRRIYFWSVLLQI